MKINAKGISFSYYGDTLTWVWPWKRQSFITGGKKFKFLSAITSQSYLSLRDYWHSLGVQSEALRKSKIIGFNDRQIFLEWIVTKFNSVLVVVLRHLNVEEKSNTFWAAIPHNERHELKKDVSVLFFTDLDKAYNVALSVEPEFAEVYVLQNGQLKYTNIGHESEYKPYWLKGSNISM